MRSLDEEFDRRYPVNAAVKPSGEVTWDPTGYFKSNCRMDVTWFPFDTHSCDLNFYSWGYYATHLNITLEDMQVLDALFVDNGEWMLQGE